jgi:hypothetical protein
MSLRTHLKIVFSPHPPEADSSRRRVLVSNPRKPAVCVSQIPVQPGRLETRILLDLVEDPGPDRGNENPNLETGSISYLKKALLGHYVDDWVTV